MGTLKYNKVFNTRGHTYLTCRLHYQWIIHKYKCLSSFLLEIEREYVIAVLRKGVGRNSLNVYLAFWRVPSESIFSFTSLRDFFSALAWRHQFFLSKILSAFSPGVWHEIRPCVHGGLRPLNWFPYPYFRWWKGSYFRFRVLANHLASFSNHPVTECKHLLAFILTWICYGHQELTYIPIPLFNSQSLAAC